MVNTEKHRYGLGMSALALVLLAGPERSAVSGVSTHLNLLFASSLAQEFDLKHFPSPASAWQLWLPAPPVRTR